MIQGREESTIIPHRLRGKKIKSEKIETKKKGPSSSDKGDRVRKGDSGKAEPAGGRLSHSKW